MTIPIPPASVTPPADLEEVPTTQRRAPGWWRRNRLALISLAVIAPLTAIGIGGNEWREYYGYGARPFVPKVLEKGESAELAGATWGPVRSGIIDDLSGFDVPDGAQVVAVAVPVETVEGVTCQAPTLVQKSTGREWESARAEIGLLSNPDEPEQCFSSETGSYELIVPYVLPDDVEGPFWVDVWPQDGRESFLRFSIDP